MTTEAQKNNFFAEAKKVFVAVCDEARDEFDAANRVNSLEADFSASRELWEQEARAEAWRLLVNVFHIDEAAADEIVSWL